MTGTPQSATMAKSTRTPRIEACFETVEEAIDALESGELPLDDALKRYEDGLKAIKAARRHLDGFAQRIAELREAAEAEAEG